MFMRKMDDKVVRGRWFGLVAALSILLIGWDGAAAYADGASVVRGGRLYDNWARELHVMFPAGFNPAFPEAARSGVATEDTWRCRTCHGWDYRGDGRKTVGITDKKGADPSSIVAILKDDAHGYADLLGERDLLDLADFVSLGQVDMNDFIDRETRLAKSNARAFEDYYVTICAGCHGRGGESVRDVPPLGDVVHNSPYEAMHMILNGHPGGNMPPLRVLGTDVAAGMLAYLQTLPGINLSASIVRGGRLYDNWQTELRALPPPVPHPAYPATAAYAEDAPRTWRCKECHGWDYLGAKGAYATGSHVTGIKGIRDMAGADPAAVVAVLRDRLHRFGAVLKARDLIDLANFVSLGQVDMNAAIDRKTGKAKGDANRVTDHYGTICAACHGANGTKIATSPPLGRTARDNPWETLHKIVNGHPNENMPALRVLDVEFFVDMLALLQQLPEDR